MSEQEKFSYPGSETNVQWDGRLCIHYGDCGRASGELFVGGRQPWCQPDLSSDTDIRDVVLRCPTGALTAKFADGSGVVPDSEENRVTVTQDGPLYVSGLLNFEGGPEEVPGDDTPGTRFRAALCRCGASKNKPFCDNSHIDAGFTDSGAVGKAGPGHSVEAGELTIRPLKDGPLMIDGKLTIFASSGRKAWKAKKLHFAVVVSRRISRSAMVVTLRLGSGVVDYDAP